MNKPLKSPNLPQSRVACVAVSDYSPILIKKLRELNIEPVITLKKGRLDDTVSYHTDMLVMNLSEGIILADESQNANIVKYLTIGYKCNVINNVCSPYPNDSLLNAVIMGDKLICNPAVIDKQILRFANENDYRIISVKQGYTKCSTCVINENALITDDESIYNVCIKNGIDALYVCKGSVKLDGYDYGFIGGCTGLIDKNKLLFNGDINYHKDCNKISDFLNKYSIEPIIIENEQLYDIGGILPLCEKTT